MPQANNAKNEEYQRHERRRKVATLYLQGKTQWDIARFVKVSQGTISNDLAAIRKDWLASTLRDFDAKKAEELAKLDNLEAVAWEAWSRSCRDAETTHQRTEEGLRLGPPKSGKGKSKGKEKARLILIRRIQEKTTKQQVGDPRFLERVAWCVETRLKILGVLKPNQTNVHQTAIVDWNAIAQEVERLPKQVSVEEQLEQMIQGMEGERKQGQLPRPSTNGTSYE